MATVEHNGSFSIGDTLVYKYSGGIYYGHKLLKSTYIGEIGEYRYITEFVKIRDGEVIKYVNGSLDLVTDDSLKKEYKLKWTKDPEYKKGDILLGKDNMVFVYISDSHVERLTPRKDFAEHGLDDRQGYSSLNDYRTNFGPLTKAVPTHPYMSSF